MITIIFAASIFILLLAIFFASLFKACYEGKDTIKQESKEPILPENELFKVMMESVSKGWDIFADEKELILTHKDFSFSIVIYARTDRDGGMEPVRCDYKIYESGETTFGELLSCRLNHIHEDNGIMHLLMSSVCKIKSTPEVDKHLNSKEILLIIEKILSTDNPVVKAVVDEEECKRLKEKQKLIDIFK